MITRIALRGRQPLEYLLVFLLLCSLIILALWPWPLHFQTGFPDHFDPPFHAWKLQVEADKLLQNHQLVPDTNTNIYYPYSNELYFDALLWPQGVVAALLKVVGCGPILSYNFVLLFFWGLSGLFMYLLLRELNLRRLPSFFGATAMCLIPYRISYYVEFNMQMCFGLPLFLFFWVRYAKSPGVGNAVGLAVAFWLQAVSELYQAVILALSFPLITLPFLHDIFKKHGRSRRLYISILAGLVTVIPLSLLYLGPYFSLFHGGYGRKTKEMMAHSLEPLAYLGNELTQWIFHVDFPGTVKTDEMSVYPSLTLLVLALCYGLYARCIFHASPKKTEHKSIILLRWLRVASMVAFVLLIGFLIRDDQPYGHKLLLIVGNGTLILAMFSTILLAKTTTPERYAGRLCGGLAGAALLCFILSLGPSLRVLSQHVVADNLVFSFVNTFFPLNGFRVMSRFSIIVMIFLVVVAACFLDMLANRKQPFQWLALPLIATLLFEAYTIPHPYRSFSLPIAPKTLEMIQRQPEKTVTVVPLGDRYLDARYMLAIGRAKTLLVNGFGGFSPHLQLKIGRALKLNPERALSLIRSIWPESLIVIDRKALKQLNKIGYATREQKIREQGVLIAEDASFAVYAITEPEKPLDEYRKFVRADLLRANPVYTFEAKKMNGGQSPQDLFVLLNGTVIDSVQLETDWRQYEIRIPAQGITGVDYEMVFLRAITPETWTARKGSFRPMSSASKIVEPNYESLASQVQSSGSPQWMTYTTSLPEEILPLNMEFTNGIHLLGIDVDEKQVQPGEQFNFQSFWTIPPSLGKSAFLAQVDCIGPEGSKITNTFALAHNLPFTFIISQPVRKIFVERQSFSVPIQTRGGEYTMHISLLNAGTGKKITVKSSLPLKSNMNGWPKIIIGEP